MDRRVGALTGGQGNRPLGVVAGFTLKTARRAASMTQEQLAATLMVDISTIQGWESGRRPLAAVSAGDLLRISQRLARAGAPLAVVNCIPQALAADLVLSCGTQTEGGAVELTLHPLASAVLRRTTAKLVSLPLTGTSPQILASAATSIGAPISSPLNFPSLIVHDSSIT